MCVSVHVCESESMWVIVHVRMHACGAVCVVNDSLLTQEAIVDISNRYDFFSDTAERRRCACLCLRERKAKLVRACKSGCG